jgi:glyoxylase-like metal-dependent hydrolase (beta-lactamase superfamily II)/ketosteroid isomerase-like protein
MRKSLMASLAAFAAFLGPALWAEAEFQVIRLGEKAAVFQIGRESGTNVVVLASRRGLVVIDTGVLPSRAEALRSAIAKEFNRTDFAYVINTHPHFDHVDGNRAFSETPIVAHQNSIRQMRQWYGSPAGIDAFLRTRSEWKTELEARLKKEAAGSLDEARAREQMAENDALMDDFRNGRFSLSLPGLTFNDRLTLRLDDLTLNLIYFGRAHTESDILVHVPELRLLLVGDLFFKTWLPSFQGPPSDVTRWFQVLESLPAAEGAVETVVDGHSKPMTGDSFRAQVAYLKDVWDGVAAARREEATLAATKEKFPFEKKYPDLAGLTRLWEGQDLHAANIEAAWRLQSESTARALEAPSTALDAEKEKIAQVISSVIGWAKTKDLSLFYGAIAQDEDYISVTPGKRVIKRFEDVKQNVPFWMSPDFQYVRHELKDLEIKFARCGEVAWFFCILDDINTYKGQPASWENTRWTGVVEKRDGRWVVVQQHFSFASDK